MDFPDASVKIRRREQNGNKHIRGNIFGTWSQHEEYNAPPNVYYSTDKERNSISYPVNFTVLKRNNSNVTTASTF